MKTPDWPGFSATTCGLRPVGVGFVYVSTRYQVYPSIGIHTSSQELALVRACLAVLRLNVWDLGWPQVERSGGVDEHQSAGRLQREQSGALPHPIPITPM